VIARTVEICEPDLMSKHLTLSLRLNAVRTWVNADPGRLQQILWNLVKNAVKFTPGGGEIVVETADLPDDRLEVKVIDRGIGIEPDALPRIFDAFEQADDAITRRFGGLGLGLAICRMLTEHHHGTLEASSAGKDQGATFTLTLPTVSPPDPVAPPVVGAPARHPARRSLRILLVEDDDATAEILTGLLRSVGHTTRAVNDCASAAAQLRGELDLLICDIALPDGTGLDLIRQFKRDSLKSIALTGYGAETDVQNSLDAGFDRHLTKPVTLTQVVAAIDELFP
jgi:CheY-like chemotaxis protein